LPTARINGMKAIMKPGPIPLLIGLALFPTVATAADQVGATGSDFAVVDMKAVFARHPATEKASRELTEAREASRAEFKEKSNLLKQILQRHQELIRAGNRDAAAAELEKANAAERSIATLKTTGERDLEEKFRKAKLKIMEEIKVAVEGFNDDGRFALVFDSSSASSNGLPQVVHAPGAIDITAEVIDFITKKDKK